MSGNMAFEPRLARTNFRSNGSQITTSELDMSLIPTIVIGNDSIDEPPSPRRNLEGDHPYAPNEHREVTGKIKSQLRLSLIRHRDSPPSYSTFGFTHASLVPRTLSNEVIMLLVRENGWCRVGTTTPLQPSDFVPDVNHDYRPTLAILLLIDCEMAIASLIDEQISAAVLPLHAEELENEIHFRRSDPQGRPGAPAELRSLALATSRENFSSRQYKVMAPRFTITKSAGNMFEAEHKIFSQDTILPWCQAMEGDNAARDPGAIESGFAQVRKVRMDPRSHDFDEVIKKVRRTMLFAWLMPRPFE